MRALDVTTITTSTYDWVDSNVGGRLTAINSVVSNAVAIVAAATVVQILGDVGCDLNFFAARQRGTRGAMNVSRKPEFVVISYVIDTVVARIT